MLHIHIKSTDSSATISSQSYREPRPRIRLIGNTNSSSCDKSGLSVRSGQRTDPDPSLEGLPRPPPLKEAQVPSPQQQENTDP